MLLSPTHPTHSQAFLSRKDFRLVFDAMHAVTGPYAQRILVQVGR
jgi:phosphoglucomutase